MVITEKSRYLVIPVSKKAEKSKLYIREGRQLLIDLDVHLDFAAPETCFYYDLARFAGINVTVSHETGFSFGFSEKKPDAPAEACRPALHFSADTGWINDPNGLVFYEGRYHAFFQHNPVGTGWGNMHWGHAVSDDLLHWTELDEALFPDEMGDMFSGSAIVDEDNLLGLNTKEHKALLLFYTAAGDLRELSKGAKFTQCLAYSTDGGVTFTKYAHNPIVPHIKAANRDPKVMRDAASGLYLMGLYLDGTEYALLTSPDLINWTELQHFSLPGDDECPDLYPMNGKWVVSGAHDTFRVCDFDPAVGFVNFTEPKKLGFGRCYAAQSFNGPDRRLRISWNRFEVPSNCFNSTLGIPCELKLDGEQLYISPVPVLDAAAKSERVEEMLPSNGIRREIGCPCDVTLSLSKLEEKVNLMLHGTAIGIDVCANTLTVGENILPLCSDDGAVTLRILCDHCGTEIFTGITENLGAKVYGSITTIPKDNVLTICGEGSLDRLTIREF